MHINYIILYFFIFKQLADWQQSTECLFTKKSAITHRMIAVKVVYGAGEGNRTLATSLEGWGSTIELHPQIKNGRSSRIRTCDPLVPSQVRYQTALCPDIKNSILFAVVYCFVLNNKDIVSYHANQRKYFFINFLQILQKTLQHYKSSRIVRILYIICRLS